MKHKALFFLSLAFVAMSANAQDDEAHKRYDEFRKQAMQKYEGFRQEANRRYGEFLKSAKENFKVLPAIPKPKDKSVPPEQKKKGDDKPLEDKNVPIKDVVTPLKSKPQPQPLEPIKDNPLQHSGDVDFTFLGTKASVRIDNDVCKGLEYLNNNPSADAVGNAWNILSSNCDNTLADCLQLREKHQLGDWAYLTMLQDVSRACAGSWNNAAAMIMGWLYCQSGYDMRFAICDGKLLPLVASPYMVFGKGYIRIDGKPFWSPLKDEPSGTIEILGGSYPKSQEMSLQMTEAMRIDDRESAARTFSGDGASAVVSVNMNLIDFFNTYPMASTDDDMMTQWSTYANTPLSDDVKAQLYPSLRTAVSGKSQYEAVSTLLHWMHTAYPMSTYKTDNDAWGYERTFFAEETLYYLYCDCEDRAILLSRLVRDLLGLRCILVYYPGHLATAVEFTQGDVKGDYISIAGCRFVITDPTYLGARVGETMPGMDNNGANVIILK